MAPYGFRGCLSLLRMLVFSPERAGGGLTLRRTVVLGLVVPGMLLLQVIHRIALALDEILFPDFRNVQVRKPVFIVGIPRSGTTLLYRLLAKDTERFATFNLWELLFAPSILERRFWSVVGSLDRAVGRPGYRLLAGFDRYLFRKLSTIHPTSLFAPEEDELVLLPIFASSFMFPVFPYPKRLRYLTHFDTCTTREDRDYIMGFYRACIQRHLYVHGADKQFLSKNPTFSSKTDALNETFPDGVVICNVRAPHAVVPSLVSLLAYAWDRFGNDAVDVPALMEVIGHYYRHPMERLPLYPETRHAFVRYDDLHAGPMETVETLYGRFGFEVSPVFRDRLEQACAAARAFRSTHVYSLEQYQLELEDIRRDFADVFDRFGFEVR